MSGTGKSTVLAALREQGFETVDTDEPGWTSWDDEDGGYVWNEDRIADLLDRERDVTLYLSVTVSNQGRFYPRFDAIVLLSAPAEVLFERIASRTTNDYGKNEAERELILQHSPRSSPSCARRARTRSTPHFRSTPSSPSSPASARSSSPFPDGS
jgi:dephospho-CoA kinase